LLLSSLYLFRSSIFALGLKALMKATASNRMKSGEERAASFLRSVVFSLLLLLTVLVAIPYGTVEPWWQALFECAVFGLGALWMIEGFLEGSSRLSSFKLFWPLLGLAAFALLQTVPAGAQADVSLKVSGLWEATSADPHGTRRWVAKLLFRPGLLEIDDRLLNVRLLRQDTLLEVFGFSGLKRHRVHQHQPGKFPDALPLFVLQVYRQRITADGLFGIVANLTGEIPAVLIFHECAFNTLQDQSAVIRDGTGTRSWGSNRLWPRRCSEPYSRSRRV
jgi:hypothetical protein